MPTQEQIVKASVAGQDLIDNAPSPLSVEDEEESHEQLLFAIDGDIDRLEHWFQELQSRAVGALRHKLLLQQEETGENDEVLVKELVQAFCQTFDRIFRDIDLLRKYFRIN